MTSANHGSGLAMGNLEPSPAFATTYHTVSWQGTEATTSPRSTHMTIEDPHDHGTLTDSETDHHEHTYLPLQAHGKEYHGTTVSRPEHDHETIRDHPLLSLLPLCFISASRHLRIETISFCA
ncbi:unnamed protein product [Absidia cylindrospora]